MSNTIRKNALLLIALMVILLSSLCLTAWSQEYTYSDSDLDEILAPIALYPDPLLAQILPAATYPDELAQASYFTGQMGDTRDIDQQDWDVSIKAIAYYPSVLSMLVDKPDWTTAVGQAYVDQPDDVMRSIQRLRGRARSYGYLSTNSYERVYLDSGYIRVVPVQARYIYVPQYDPHMVYLQRGSTVNSNVVIFGLGLLIGSWLNCDMDWQRNQVYYHGWSGGGWIGNSRSYVSTTNNYYVNNNYRNAPIAIDRNVTTRNITGYKNSVRDRAGNFQSTNYPRVNRPSVRPNVTYTRPPIAPRVTNTRPTAIRDRNTVSPSRIPTITQPYVPRTTREPVTNARPITNRNNNTNSPSRTPRITQPYVPTNSRAQVNDARPTSKSRSTSKSKKAAGNSGSKQSRDNKNNSKRN